MDGFAQSLPFVLRWEGGFVDDPDDPGGRTNKGVTQAVYKAWRAGEGLAPRDVAQIEDAEVAAIYERDYWRRAQACTLPRKLDLVQFDREFDRIYRVVNKRFAQTLATLVSDDDLVWIHDYHFFYLGSELRQTGFNGRLGYFLHIPFAPPEIFTALPGSHDMVRAMLAYDLIGFQTPQDRRNFANFCVHELGGEKLPGDRIKVGDRVKVRLVNEMAGDHPMHHPFHVHGAGRFLILSRDGVVESSLVWKDTVLVRTGETVDILLDVTNPGLWMAHCHIAEHTESGMMFSFDVAPAADPS